MIFSESFVYVFNFLEDLLCELPSYDENKFKSTRFYQETIATIISSRFVQASDPKLEEMYLAIVKLSGVIKYNHDNKVLLNTSKSGWLFVGEDFYNCLFFLPFKNIERSFFCHIPKTAGTALMSFAQQISDSQSYQEICLLYVATDFRSIEPSKQDPNLLLRAIYECIAIKNAMTSNHKILLVRCGHYCLESELNRLKNVENVNGKQRVLISVREPFEIIKSGLRFYFSLLGTNNLKNVIPNDNDFVGQFQENYSSWKSGAAPLDAFLGKKIALALLESDSFKSFVTNDPISSYISVNPENCIDYLKEIQHAGYTTQAVEKPNFRSIMFLLHLPDGINIINSTDFDKPVNSSATSSQEFAGVIEDNELRELLSSRGTLKYSEKCYSYLEYLCI